MMREQTVADPEAAEADRAPGLARGRRLSDAGGRWVRRVGLLVFPPSGSGGSRADSALEGEGATLGVLVDVECVGQCFDEVQAECLVESGRGVVWWSAESELVHGDRGRVVGHGSLEFQDQGGSLARLSDHDREDFGAGELEIEDGAAYGAEVAEPVGQFCAEDRLGRPSGG
jgi:hypothetical protein